MVSFEAGITFVITGGFFLLAALAPPQVGFPQTAFETVASHEQRELQFIENIQLEQSNNGPSSPALIEPLTALALLYQDRGDYALAAVAIGRALQVVRTSQGLHSFDQAPLLRQSIHTEEARNNLAAAWDLEQQLLSLARRNPDDLRIAPILHEIADRKMAVLSKYVAGEFPPQLFLGCFYRPPNDRFASCYSGSKNVVIRSIVSAAQRHYLDAVRVILRHQRYSSEELQELEMKLVRTSFTHSNYQLGKRSLRRLLSYSVANSKPWLNRIDALVQTADWELLFSHNGRALDVYEQAYAHLKEKGIDQASIEQIFAPAIPVVLPSFMPNPLIPDGTQQTTEYIDVAFRINRFGLGRRIKILDTTTGVTNAAKNRLVRVILRSRFRPRVTNGQLAEKSEIALRYYLKD